MRRSALIAAALLVIAFVLVGGPSLLFSPHSSDVVPEETDDPGPETLTFEGSDSGIWPYLSAREAHDERSPINVLVRGESEEVVRLLVEEGEGDWVEIDEELDDADQETFSLVEDEGHHATGTGWGEAAGTTRYAWVDPGDGEPYWTTETLQLDDGDYYGHRMHIRLYESPNDEDRWVAMQGHTEHFDWFTLRHRVDGVEAAQLAIEREFMDLPGIDAREDVRRMNLDNSGPSDADGWATKVDLTAMTALLAVGLAARREGLLERAEGEADEHLTDVDRARLAAAYDRLEAEHLILAAVILTLILGVRVLGIALDRHAGFLTVHMIAGSLYPIIAIGLPVATYLVARGLESRLDAAVAASTSLAVAIWLDYALVGVDSLPIDVVLQRALVLVALGLIAGGAAARARRDGPLNDMLVAGVALWVLVLVGTLFGYL